MTTDATTADKRSSPAAGAVLLWCVLAGGVVAAGLMLEPPEGRGLEFWTPAGVLRILADLAILHVVFLVPLFAWRKARALRAAAEAAAVVVFTGTLGFVMIDNLVGLGAGALAKLIGFVALSAVGAVVWAEALRERPAWYYGFAGVFAFGVPLVAFFSYELFRIEAPWLAWFSPFTAWRAIVDAGSWVPWALFGADLAAGLVWLALRLRRARP